MAPLSTFLRVSVPLELKLRNKQRNSSVTAIVTWRLQPFCRLDG